MTKVKYIYILCFGSVDLVALHAARLLYFQIDNKFKINPVNDETKSIDWRQINFPLNQKHKIHKRKKI